MAKDDRGEGRSSSAMRRQELRRAVPRSDLDWKGFLRRPGTLRTLLLLAALVGVLASLATWSHQQVRVRDGQIMTATRLKRFDYAVEDASATQQRRQEARRSAPRIHVLNEPLLERLGAALRGLPTAVADRTELDDVAEDLVAAFTLDDAALQALQAMSVDGVATASWNTWVDRLLHEELPRRPLLDGEVFQRWSMLLPASRALWRAEGELEQPYLADAVDIDAVPGNLLSTMAERAGFPETLAPAVATRILHEEQPTVLLDTDRSARIAEMAAAAVEPVLVQHRRGEIIWRRGDRLEPGQYEAALQEAQHFAEEGPPLLVWSHRLGTTGLIGAMIAFLALFMRGSYRRVLGKTWRLAAIGLLMSGALVVTVLVATEAPRFLQAAAVAPTLFTVLVILLAYDQRLALVVAAIQGALVAFSLEQGIGWYVLLLLGCATAVALLREIRHRNSLIRATTSAAVVIGLGTLLLSPTAAPAVPAIWGQSLLDAMLGAIAAIGVGFLVLGLLPSIERLFDITTGMTLMELRDPRRQLLRRLQQHAPGTYNHALQVANIAEAAADAIGADSLLAYVGALYHDVGKINKPKYFVENQAEGENVHEGLSPAMSLLVIVGHVKDGLELARDHGLPRPIVHFIESHHGTTLVEYFYRAAREQAGETGEVDEVAYRYPGPKPRTKEAAILMIADVVESATRSMSEPTAGRIESTVRDLSRKRLADGQFERCDLTFDELRRVEDAVIARLASIYHARIPYPSDEEKGDAEPGGDDNAGENDQIRPSSLPFRTG